MVCISWFSYKPGFARNLGNIIWEKYEPRLYEGSQLKSMENFPRASSLIYVLFRNDLNLISRGTCYIIYQIHSFEKNIAKRN